MAHRAATDRVVFFGTPEFAVPTLDALCSTGRTPVLVVSQPARPVGRHRRREQPPVAHRARERELRLEQPESVRQPDFVELLGRVAPDVVVVAAFGQIFPRSLLDLPGLGCVNLHASLLPRHRGAAPIQAAIAAGDEHTGVTTMLMEQGLDSGPILQTRACEIGPRETAGELSLRLAELGAELVVETLDALAAGTLVPVRQDDRLATYAPRLSRQDGRLDWTTPGRHLERLVRAYTPWPGTFTELRGEILKVMAAELDSGSAGTGVSPPGELVAVTADSLLVACGDGRVLALRIVQRPGKRPVSGAELANGLRLAPGERLG